MEDAVWIIASALFTDVAITDANNGLLATTDPSLEALVSLPIEIHQECLGSLLLVEKDAIQEDMRNVVLQYISYPLTLWFNKIQIERITETRLTSDFVLRLARGPVTDAVVRDAGYLGFPLHKAYRAIVMQITSDDHGIGPSILQHSPEINAFVVQEGKKLQLSVIAGDDLEHFIAFIEAPSLLGDTILSRLLDRWENRIRELLPGSCCLMGISQPFPGEQGPDENVGRFL